MRTTCLFAVLSTIVAAIGMGCTKAPSAGTTSQPATSDAKEVSVYMYSEYISQDIRDEFEKVTGYKLRVDVYEMTEEMIAKLQQAGGTEQYDVVVVSDHAIPVLVKLGLIQPLEQNLVPNMKNVAERFRSPSYDPGSKYSLPYQWGTMGLMYNKEKLPDFKPTWAACFDEAAQPGRFVLIDSMRDMFAAVLKYQGKSVNTRKAEDLKAAQELLLKTKKSPKLVGFEGGVGGKDKVVTGDAVLAVVYNGDALRGIEENKKLDFVLPKEGSIIWVDAMTVSAKAPNKDGAYKFMDYILDAKVGAQLSNFNRYATPNQASLDLKEGGITPEDRANPAIYPDEETMKGLEYIEDVGDSTRLYDEVWTAVKSR
jgi:spermidine/putrescine transport system substrate-binding protein